MSLKSTLSQIGVKDDDEIVIVSVFVIIFVHSTSLNQNYIKGFLLDIRSSFHR